MFVWFLFSWKLTPVRDDSLVNFVPQFILQISITVFFQYSRVTQDTRFEHITAASKQLLVASARGQTETCASYRCQQQFCCFENGSGRFSVTAIEELPLRALWYKAVFSIRATNSWATKFASARLALHNLPPTSFIECSWWSVVWKVLRSMFGGTEVKEICRKRYN